MLVPSNPTNLVLSGAFSISFINYTAHVILPFLAAAFVVFPTLTACFFRSETLVPQTIDFDPAEVRDRNAALVDKKGAIFGSILLVLTLGVLVGTSTIGISVWEVTVPAAVIMLARDVHHDWTQAIAWRTDSRESSQSAAYPMELVNGSATEENGPHRRPIHKSPTVDDENRTEPTRSCDLVSYTKRYLHLLSSRFPTTTTVFKRLPISLLPFAFLMFILVQGLSAQGWVEVFAGWWTVWVNETGTIGAIGGMGFISCMLCNVRIRLAYVNAHPITDHIHHRFAVPISEPPYSLPESSKSGYLKQKHSIPEPKMVLSMLSRSAPTTEHLRLRSPRPLLVYFGVRSSSRREYESVDPISSF